jgi:hypothetical protein
MMELKAESKRESDPPPEAVQNATVASPVPPDGGYGWLQVLVAQ